MMKLLGKRKRATHERKREKKIAYCNLGRNCLNLLRNFYKKLYLLIISLGIIMKLVGYLV